ncbi:MAG TPA: hypothetical protein VJM34_01540 [Novosphingobium sp.]|nr:hypothetical protein [Novosphingobium sp.]
MGPILWPWGDGTEYALAVDRGRGRRLLIVPALFDEGNRMRRLTVETMRRLDAAGIDSVLPDLPGTNESLQPPEAQTCGSWGEAMVTAARHFGATHTLGIRGGCLFAPHALPGWHYVPVKGASVLRQMMRARVIASREAGTQETTADLAAVAEAEGIDLIGYRLGAEFVRTFNALEVQPGNVIEQPALGAGFLGPGLWLRAEPGESAEQADALAALLVAGMGA